MILSEARYPDELPIHRKTKFKKTFVDMMKSSFMQSVAWRRRQQKLNMPLLLNEIRMLSSWKQKVHHDPPFRFVEDESDFVECEFSSSVRKYHPPIKSGKRGIDLVIYTMYSI